MSKIPNGGPVSPIITPSKFLTGMTLRDYFAAKALQGWLASYGQDHRHPAERGFCGVVVEQAYALADAMLAAREAQP